MKVEINYYKDILGGCVFPLHESSLVFVRNLGKNMCTINDTNIVLNKKRRESWHEVLDM
jgi:hypothetical protein